MGSNLLLCYILTRILPAEISKVKTVECFRYRKLYNFLNQNLIIIIKPLGFQVKLASWQPPHVVYIETVTLNNILLVQKKKCFDGSILQFWQLKTFSFWSLLIFSVGELLCPVNIAGSCNVSLL